VTVKKIKPYFQFEKKSPNDENLPQKMLFESSNHRLTINRKVFKSKEKGLTNKFWIVEYHMLSSLFGCYDQRWIGTKLEPWYKDWYCIWYQRSNNQRSNNTGWTWGNISLVLVPIWY